MNDFERSLAKLRSRYASTLVQRLDELTLALAKAESGGVDQLAEAMGLAHKLHGTTGTYGFKAVSALMGEVEDALRAAHADMPLAVAPWWSEQRQRVTLAREAATQAAAENPDDTLPPSR